MDKINPSTIDTIFKEHDLDIDHALLIYFQQLERFSAVDPPISKGDVIRGIKTIVRKVLRDEIK